MANGKPYNTLTAATVDVSSNDNISKLKKAVKAMCKPSLDRVAITGILVYKVDLNIEESRKLTTSLKQGSTINIDTYTGDSLDELVKLRRYFPRQPDEEVVHLIIDCTKSVNEIVDAALAKDVLRSNNTKRLSDPEKAVQALRERYGYTPRLGGYGGVFGNASKDDIYSQFYEGIDVDDKAKFIARDEIVTRLLNDLSTYRIMIVRSPPMTGKSSLAQLVEKRLKDQIEADTSGMPKRVFLLSMLSMGRGTGDWTFAEQFQKLMGGVSWDEFVVECIRVETYLIVDEAQVLYSSTGRIEDCRHRGEALWGVQKWTRQRQGNLKLLAFATYGYDGAWDSSNLAVELYSPSEDLPSGARWGLEDIRFTETEFQEYTERFFVRYTKENLSTKDIDQLRTEIWRATLGHPGFVAVIYDLLRKQFDSTFRSRNPDKKRLPVTVSQIFVYMRSGEFAVGLQNVRASKTFDNLTAEQKTICDLVLASSQGIVLSRLPHSHEQAIIQLFKTFVLSLYGDPTSPTSTVNFAAPILRVVYLQKRYGKVIKASNPVTNFREFIIGVFKNMIQEHLALSLGKGEDGLYERTWQMEFFRSASQILPEGDVVSPDFGALLGTDGRLDFWVGGDKRWAVELLRDGKRLKEHEARWDDSYACLIQEANDYALLDIRSQRMRPRGTRNRHPQAVTVLYSDDYSSVEIMLPGETTTTDVTLSCNSNRT
ncbi:hypothetical protein BZG36_05572 [Bifiguratus adelaidae]|uniref:Crinkler effector protein N-terminal domain-containing protein n=1 Tax=Bifiguratus adelaidae TaxID=1938954 RepID=A0A261XT26_9FUNG|nr:hypothetical protein BZG36_05572 [Bifiguratus adelaidae]